MLIRPCVPGNCYRSTSDPKLRDWSRKKRTLNGFGICRLRLRRQVLARSKPFNAKTLMNLANSSQLQDRIQDQQYDADSQKPFGDEIVFRSEVCTEV